MTIRLRQSTASQEIPLGPFVDSTDGDTAKTGLTIANTDINLWKMGATSLANKNSGGATHMAGGIYYAVLDATDTDTLGALAIFVHVSGALYVKTECEVLAANVYDSWIAGSDLLDVSTKQFDGAAVTQSGGRPEVNATHVAGTSQTAGDIIGDTNDIQARLPAALVSGRIDASVGAMASAVLTATAIASDAITDAKVASDVTIASVTGSVGSVTGAVGSVTGAVGSVTGNVGGNVTGSVGSIATGGIAATSFAAGAINAAAIATNAIDADALAADAVTEIQTGLSTLDAAGVRTAVGLASANLDTQIAALPTAPENADAVWDEALAGHATAGSAGVALSDAGAGGDPWAVVLDGVYTAQDLLRIAAAVMAGKTTITPTTAGGATIVFRDVSDASDIVTAQCSASPSERTAVTLAP